jgi:hypothetical protein
MVRLAIAPVSRAASEPGSPGYDGAVVVRRVPDGTRMLCHVSTSNTLYLHAICTQQRCCCDKE